MCFILDLVITLQAYCPEGQDGKLTSEKEFSSLKASQEAAFLTHSGCFTFHFMIFMKIFSKNSLQIMFNFLQSQG